MQSSKYELLTSSCLLVDILIVKLNLDWTRSKLWVKAKVDTKAILSIIFGNKL